MIRVVVADDEALIRTGLRILIEREADLEFVGEAADGRAALHLIRQTRPDVALLDIRMPGMDGLATLRAIAGDPVLVGTRAVIVTTFETDHNVFAALQAGASGFILKDTEPAELIRAIRVVAAGDALLSPSVTQRVIARFGAAGAPDPPVTMDLLTEREREIVAWVATGRSNDEIAAELFLSPATVRTHVGRAMLKIFRPGPRSTRRLRHQRGPHRPARRSRRLTMIVAGNARLSRRVFTIRKTWRFYERGA